MKTRAFYVCFLAACLALLLVPLAGMAFAGPGQSIGNEGAVPWPSLFDSDGSVNQDFLKEAGDYFEHHFAFRSELITADAVVQERVLLSSNTEHVITGSDGWLYYASTLSDYLGRDTLSERGLYNLAHNLRLINDYVEGRGAKLLFMIPPNKNSLYGEHMPYYDSLPYRSAQTRERFRSAFDGEGVRYLDLFELFLSQEEVLYFREDSHWNSKGALLVYREAMQRLGKEHESYERAEVTRVKDHSGDLSAMLFPSLQSAEWDYHYGGIQKYEYLVTARSRSETVSVQDYHIEAVCESARGTLLMYRDSFGDSLIPFFANEYGYSVFSKTIPYQLASDLEAYRPEHVVIERVERSVRDLIEAPPIIPAQAADAEELAAIQGGHVAELSRADGAITVQCELCEADRSYILFSGTLPGEPADPGCQIYLEIGWPDGREALFHTYYRSDAETDYGFAAYLPLSEFGTLADAQNARLSVCVAQT